MKTFEVRRADGRWEEGKIVVIRNYSSNQSTAWQLSPSEAVDLWQELSKRLIPLVREIWAERQESDH